MKIAFLTALLGVGSVFAYGQYKCPIDNSSMQWTGQTRSEWAKMLREYRCLNGHTTWIVQ